VDPPKYLSTPHIDLLDITFKRGNAAANQQDTLIFRLKFTDGDGDLGVTDADSNSVESYNPLYYYYSTSNFSVQPWINPTDQFTGYKVINYAVKRSIAQFDTLPPLLCGSWEPLRKNGVVVDTIYTKQNLKAYNVNVDIYSKNNGVYETFDPWIADAEWNQCSYNLFRAAFPDLSNGRQTALDGVITFRIGSFSLYEIFNTRTLQMNIVIYDRARHVSNVVGKKDFTIAQITK
jgi:hypothetical protein